MEIQRYNKAIIAVVVGAVFLVLNQFGLTEQSTIKDLVELIVSGLAVYMVPNKQ